MEVNSKFINRTFVIILLSLSIYCVPEKEENQDALIALLALSQAGNSSSQNTNCPPANLPSEIPIANTVVSANSTIANFDDSSKAINGICGGGENSGSLDVYALNLAGTGSSLILSWGGRTVKNVQGIDFVVYENAFKLSDTSDRYAFDPTVVQVSLDGSIYCGFNLSGYNSSTADSNKISSWPGFGGLRPVLYNMTTRTFNLTELFTSSGNGFLVGGGDGFDLDNLYDSDTQNTACNTAAKNNIQANGFKFIKLISATAVINPATGNGYAYPHAFTNGPDIDGVIAKSVE